MSFSLTLFKSAHKKEKFKVKFNLSAAPSLFLHIQFSGIMHLNSNYKFIITSKVLVISPWVLWFTQELICGKLQ